MPQGAGATGSLPP